MKWQGVRHAKVLKTPEDVLEHSYGVKPTESAAKPSIPPPPPPATQPSPPSEPEAVEMDEDEYAAHIERSMSKDELKAIAEGYGLDTSGNKPDIAARIAAHEYSEE